MIIVNLSAFSQSNYYEFAHDVLNHLSDSRGQLIEENFLLCDRTKGFLNSEFFLQTLEAVQTKGFIYKNEEGKLKTFKLSSDLLQELSTKENWSISEFKNCDCNYQYWNPLYLKKEIRLIDKTSEIFKKHSVSTIEAIAMNKEFVLLVKSFSGKKNAFLLTKINDKWTVVFAHTNLIVPSE